MRKQSLLWSIAKRLNFFTFHQVSHLSVPILFRTQAPACSCLYMWLFKDHFLQHSQAPAQATATWYRFKFLLLHMFRLLLKFLVRFLLQCLNQALLFTPAQAQLQHLLKLSLKFLLKRCSLRAQALLQHLLKPLLKFLLQGLLKHCTLPAQALHFTRSSTALYPLKHCTLPA